MLLNFNLNISSLRKYSIGRSLLCLSVFLLTFFPSRIVPQIIIVFLLSPDKLLSVDNIYFNCSSLMYGLFCFGEF